MDDNDIKVSICCITYNQEKYIRDAIESFLSQKTNFKYEIIIRDDASTDNTAKIVKEYEEKYPDIIHGIYEKVNGFKRGVKRAINVTFEIAKGKYIAICEGDDYWTDENKLQIQYDYMEKHPDCSFCFHNAVIYDEEVKKNTVNFIPRYKKQLKYLKKDNIYNVGELALLDQIPTASYFFYNSNNWPNWFFNCIVGDLPLQLIRTNDGYAYYIDKVMSAYRIGTNISMMDKFRRENSDVNKVINRINGYIYIYKNVNEMTDYKYDKDLKIIINDLIVSKLILSPPDSLTEEEKMALSDSKLTRKIKYFLNKHFSVLYQFLRKTKHKLTKRKK